MIVDSGNQALTPDRIDLIAEILSQLKYDAVGVGMTDIQMGKPFLKAMSDRKVPVLFAGSRTIESTVPYVVKNVGGVRVGIVSFAGSNFADGGSDFAQRKAMYVAFKAARDASDVLILLDQANTANADWLVRNAKRFGSPDIVIGGIAGTLIGQGQTVGSTTIGATASQSKSVGVVDIEFTPGSAPKLTAQLIPLDETVVPDEAVAARVKEFMDKLNPLPTPVARPPAAPPVPPQPGKPYHASENCKGCHPRQYEDWAGSAHAQATVKLATANRAIPECLTCHSERYRRTLNAPVASTDMHGVECATCHIDSLPHGVERKTVTTRVKVDTETCLLCHTPQWSPNYDKNTYLPRVAHSGASTKSTASNPDK